METDIIDKEIRDALEEASNGKIAAEEVAAEQDLSDLGLTSHEVIQWMVGIEEALDIEFEDEHLKRETFASIAAVQRTVEELLG